MNNSFTKIETEVIKNASNNISVINKELDNESKMVSEAIKRLDSVWKGKAANIVIDKYEDMKNNLMTARYNEIENYVKYLYHLIGEGYEFVENENVKLVEEWV